MTGNVVSLAAEWRRRTPQGRELAAWEKIIQQAENFWPGGDAWLAAQKARADGWKPDQHCSTSSMLSKKGKRRVVLSFCPGGKMSQAVSFTRKGRLA